MNTLFKTLFQTTKSFFFSTTETTKHGPHIRDVFDIKRLMMLVVIALLPCTFMAIFNTGLQSYVFSSFNPSLLTEYLTASSSLSQFLAFSTKHFLPIFLKGLYYFLPILILTYLVGGFWEIIFAAFRGKEVSEGFLVTGILIALIMPATIPYWMIIVGVSAGIIIGKELFGGTGMNLLNPALVCRCIIYFSYPAYITGDIWVAPNPTVVKESVMQMNTALNTSVKDAISTATFLPTVEASTAVKRIHVETISLYRGVETSSKPIILTYLKNYDRDLDINSMSLDELRAFVTSEKGLRLSPEYFTPAYQLAKLQSGLPPANNTNLFIGNMIGSMGETSKLACLLGALFLIWVGIASWRTMLGVVIGAFVTALLFEYGSHIGPQEGLWNPALFAMPAYKQFLFGGLAFGLVFMATDPVSSPSTRKAQWIYGAVIGTVTILIRLINPAYPEGVMLAILFANVFAPLFDRIVLRYHKRGVYAKIQK